ncbi:receptor-like cytosolic serine/threonine-protein kinase RBK1 isoform X3 [Juglans microcarpa x Juglans regia]|uniref:receptor-like cytosolic serine/threonine-protein kinase RBK1 isoform X3 n=1 Tax=Juglans microcarpa x Juglans regia TaxID=2249226 RepID=UPI001B7F5FEA|nr:receptor-like cytosolic serine/threonine-protein kinase RBK1 isoform X3 [Juglans microcarpa x Juglans regia]
MSVEERRGETGETPDIQTPEPHISTKKQEVSDDDESSPRGVLEIPALGATDSDHTGSSSFSSCISPTQKPAPTPPLRESHGGSQWKSVIEALKRKSMRRFSIIPLLSASHEFSAKNLSRKLGRIRSAEDGIDNDGIPRPKPSWRSFDYAELAAATDNFSSGSSECLEWKIRFKVAIGVAEGLDYLHHNCHRRIIHRDIKASNILLTQDYNAQISDFGLAKWLPEKWAHHVVFPIEGTFGYLAPEYFMHGIVDEKTDVFAFGVLLLELITGRRAVDSSRQSLAIWAKPLLDTYNVKELADPRLGDAYDPSEMKRAMYAASMCIHHLSSMRPQMNGVVQILKAEEDGPLEPKPKSVAARSLVFNACDLEDYTSTTYLNDLNRHRQLVMME